MKPFNINRNSWHYKLNQHFFNAEPMRRWEPEHNNFCSYRRATVIRVFFAAFLAVLAVCILAVLTVASINDPIGAAIVFGVFGSPVLVVGTIIGLAVLSEYIQERNRERAEKGEQPKTVIGKQYAAWKSKVCPSVEYK